MSAGLQAHPLAELLPGMSSGEFIELQRDIKKHGQRMQIILYEGMILDGRHRYAACRGIGVTPSTIEFKGDAAAAANLVLSMNLRRRHLSPQQRRDLVEDILKLNPAASDRSIAKSAKVDHKTVAAVRRKAVNGGEIPHHVRRVGADGVEQPAEGKNPRIVVDQDGDLRELRRVWAQGARMLFVCSRRHEINALLAGQVEKEKAAQGKAAQATAGGAVGGTSDAYRAADVTPTGARGQSARA